MSPQEFVSFRCVELDANPRVICGKGRARRLVAVRRILASELRGEPWNMSLPKIARALGRKNHTTVLWLLRGGRLGRHKWTTI